MLNLLQKLCELPGAPGWEDAVRDEIRSHARPVADEIREDGIGNLFVLRRGKARREKPLMVCAHMDEVAFIIKSITPDGYLHIGCAGGIDHRVMIGKRVTVGQKRIPGVIGIKAVHLTTPDERKKLPNIDELFIDIGASSAAQAERLVEPGEAAVFAGGFSELGGDCVKSKAIDDRFGCAVMLMLMHEEQEFDTWFVFTVQEEVGLRGAACAAYTLSPGSALVLEATTAADLPGMTGSARICNLGGGAVIGMADRATLYDTEYYKQLHRLADKHCIPWQTKQRIAGGTDAGAIHLSRAGVRTAAISLPVRYLHSPSCVAAKSDMDSALRLTRLAINGGIFNTGFDHNSR